jgi:hypothetical protein
MGNEERGGGERGRRGEEETGRHGDVPLLFSPSSPLLPVFYPAVSG